MVWKYAIFLTLIPVSTWSTTWSTLFHGMMEALVPCSTSKDMAYGFCRKFVQAWLWLTAIWLSVTLIYMGISFPWIISGTKNKINQSIHFWWTWATPISGNAKLLARLLDPLIQYLPVVFPVGLPLIICLFPCQRKGVPKNLRGQQTQQTQFDQSNKTQSTNHPEPWEAPPAIHQLHRWNDTGMQSGQRNQYTICGPYLSRRNNQ